MSNLSESELSKYEDAWCLPIYANHSPGEKFLPLFMDMAHPSLNDSILDAGCGSGKGALALLNKGFDRITICDFTDTGLIDEARVFRFFPVCLWKDLRHALNYQQGGKYDWVYCTDVLEHIPESLTMLTVARLLNIGKGLFLSVSVVHDSFGAWVGRPLHHTVKSFVWWRDQLNEVGEVVEGRDLLNSCVFLVKS